jgi:hypothetical protein
MGPVTLGGCVIGAFGVVWLARTVPILREARASKSWMVTTGTIIDRDTRLLGGRDGAVVPVIRYRYTVEGVAFESERITVADEGYGSWRAAKDVLARYASDTVEVRFNPERPARAVLSCALPSYMSTIVGLGIAMLAAAAGLVLYGDR